MTSAWRYCRWKPVADELRRGDSKKCSVEEVSTPRKELQDWLKTQVTDQVRALHVLFGTTPHISVLTVFTDLVLVSQRRVPASYSNESPTRV
jgi:hypothetical protein